MTISSIKMYKVGRLGSGMLTCNVMRHTEKSPTSLSGNQLNETGNETRMSVGCRLNLANVNRLNI